MHRDSVFGFGLRLFLPVVLLAALPFGGHAALKVVATTPDLGALAREVGGELVEITTLAKPTEDPHFVDAKPSFLVKLNRADALIEGGAELELGWLPPLLEGARNPRLAPGAPGRILGNQGVQMLDVPATLDRAKGDIHAAGNPHYLADPVNARIVAGHLADAFAQLDPPSAGTYRANLKRFTDRLDAKLLEWAKRMEPYRGRQVVAYHDSWPYFARRFGLKIDVFLEPKPGLPPAPAHLAGVITRMKQENTRVIVVEPYLNRRTAETVARDTGARVVDVAYLPGGVKGTEGDYVKLIDYLVSALAQAFDGGKP
jgi:zinc/manganese transport system substrate-binding protein